MEFYDNYKVVPESLTRDEAQEFHHWLRDEYGRHDRCIMGACDQIEKRPLIADILRGAIKRHREELDSIFTTRKILEELFGL